MDNIVIYTSKETSELLEPLSKIDDVSARVVSSDDLKGCTFLNVSLMVIEEAENLKDVLMTTKFTCPILFVGDIFTDLWAFGEDGGFVNSLQREGVAVHSSFAEEVMCFYASMLRAIKSYINEEVKEIHFTGHSKGGGEAILAALRFASDIKRDIGANNSVFQYVFGNEAQEVFSLFRSVFGRDNAIKVFTFSAPAVINKNGKDLFYEVIGRKNVVCIFKNLDIVPDLPYLAGKGLRPIGIQANISKGSELGYQEEVNRIVESCEEGGWMVTSEFVKNFVMKSHKLDGFNEDLIWMIMRRIEGNYENDPNMDENIMGIDRKPILRKLMIWKQ